MIKIKEENLPSGQETVSLILDNNNEITFDSYPVVIKPTHMKHLIYKATVLENKHK